MKWHVLFVDDDRDICEQTQIFLEDKPLLETGDTVQVTVVNSFKDALNQLEAHRIDIVLLDVRQEDEDDIEEEAGIRILSSIKERQFVPVIFYTNLPEAVRDLETPLIRVLEKQGAFAGLRETLIDVLKTGLPGANRHLAQHIQRVHCDYMWSFVSTHWAELISQAQPGDLAYILARRLARSLDGPVIKGFIKALGGDEDAVAEVGIHPLRYYVIPPLLDNGPFAGDIYQGSINSLDGYWAILTPSCDFPIRDGKSKAEWVLFARCVPLEEQVEYIEWQQATDQDKKLKSLESLLRNNRTIGQPERYYYLPAAFTLPDLVVDFQQIERVPRANLADLARIASLDSPFAESFLSRYVRYRGRLGTPDLDTRLIVKRLEERVHRNKSKELMDNVSQHTG